MAANDSVPGGYSLCFASGNKHKKQLLRQKLLSRPRFSGFAGQNQ